MCEPVWFLITRTATDTQTVGVRVQSELWVSDGRFVVVVTSHTNTNKNSKIIKKSSLAESNYAKHVLEHNRTIRDNSENNLIITNN